VTEEAPLPADLPDPSSPHLTRTESRRLVAALATAQGQPRRDLMTRLAWRPAWAIRSRRGTLSVLREMWRDWRRH